MPKLLQKDIPVTIEARLRAYRQTDLRYTNILRSEFANVQLFISEWNSFHRIAHEMALKQLGSLEILCLSTKANIINGFYEKKGYYYVPGANFSIQNVEAYRCWRNCVLLAWATSTSAAVEFEWPNSADAVHAGQRSSFTYP